MKRGISGRLARLAVLAAMLAATACAGGDRTITLVYISGFFQPSVQFEAEVIARYQKLHPNIRIKHTAVPHVDRTNKIKEALASNRVDIFSEETPLSSYFASGDAAPVDYEAMGFDSEQAFTRKYLSHGLDPFTFKHTLFAIPKQSDAMALFINKKLFRAAGIDPATEYPRTWEDVLTLSKRLVKRDRLGHIIQAGFDFTYPGTDDPTYQIMFPLIGQKGGSIVSADGKRSTFDSPGSVAAFTFIRDWAFKHRLGGPGGPEALNGFEEGTLAMTAKGPWLVALLEAQAKEVYDNLLVVPFPVFSDAAIPYGAQTDAFGLMVNAHAPDERQREAWRFISYLTSDPVASVRRTKNIVPRIEVSEHRAEIGRDFKFLSVFLDMLKRPQLPVYDVARSTEIYKVIEDALIRMGTVGQTPEATVAQAGREIQALLDRS